MLLCGSFLLFKFHEISLVAGLDIILSNKQITKALICAFVVRKLPKPGFLALRHKYGGNSIDHDETHFLWHLIWV